MTQILVDGVTYVSFLNGILRIECGSIDRSGKLVPSGTLLIPAAQAGPVLKSIADATRELEKRVREKAGAKQSDSGTQPTEH